MTRSAKVGEDVNNHKYAEQLERSGCTQVTEAQAHADAVGLRRVGREHVLRVAAP